MSCDVDRASARCDRAARHACIQRLARFGRHARERCTGESSCHSGHEHCQLPCFVVSPRCARLEAAVISLGKKLQHRLLDEVGTLSVLGHPHLYLSAASAVEQTLLSFASGAEGGRWIGLSRARHGLRPLDPSLHSAISQWLPASLNMLCAGRCGSGDGTL